MSTAEASPRYRVAVPLENGILMRLEIPSELLKGVKPITHGRLSSYQKRRCRCADCTAANTAWSAEFKRRKKARGE